MTEKPYDMGKNARREARRRARGKAARVLGTYLDDLLAVAAGGCLITAAALAVGAAAAFGVAGVCLGAYARIVARGRKG
ncbi:hypothetical protein ACQRBP_06380 [Eubacteriales bacterium SGI.150]